MEVTGDNTERLMPLKEEFCCLEFLRGGVPLSGPVRAVPRLVWRQEGHRESVAGGLCLLYGRMLFGGDIA